MATTGSCCAPMACRRRWTRRRSGRSFAPMNPTPPPRNCWIQPWRIGRATTLLPWYFRSATMDLTSAPPTALGKYEIRGVIGRGAMGTVYDGWGPVIGRRVAIKTVRLLDHADPEAQEGLERFKREAQAAGRLSHPNIVGVYDYGETAETAYIVMKFVEGQSLKQHLDAGERFPVAETVAIMGQVLAGLQFSHDSGVIHRDVKPGNVMITKGGPGGGRVKLADFGIARIESSVMTQDGTMLGTPAYMSPEQLMAQTVDSRTDIYSSGVVLYQLLTGER